MRRPPFASLALHVLLIGSVFAPAVRAEGQGSGAARLPGKIERRALGARDALVVSASDGSPRLAVCVALGGPMSLAAPDPLELARRGGEEQAVETRAASVWCATLPGSELAFALFLAGHLQERPSETVAGEAELRALDLATESAPPRGANPPARAVVVTGAVVPSDLFALASKGETGFGTPALPRPRPPALQLHQTSERLSVLEGSEDTPRVHYAWPVADGDPGAHAALAVAFELLAGETDSRLSRLLVPRGLARGTTAFFAPFLGGTLFGVTVVLTTRPTIDRVRRFVDGSLKQLRLVGPSSRDVERAKARLRLNALTLWEDPASRARALALTELSRGDATLFEDDLLHLDGVTAERVRNAAHDALVDARRTTLELYPKLWPTDDPALARHRLYTVSDTDTLATVAARFHVEASRLARDNDIDPRYRLVPGQPLWIPPARDGR